MADEMDLDSARGKKRKSDDLEETQERAPRRIKALDPDVVNKIAAGEIIVAPVHALKELIENSVDAGSTSIEVLCRDGGLKLLQITDNGCGIERDDLPLLCERFTTSKLQSFEDLGSIATYGFRGEALASISHIAHLTVTTKTRDSSCAWRAHYDAGRLTAPKPGQSAEPKPVAGRQGTQITVEDLFYNVPSRRRAFRSPSDEYNKIIDMVGRYSVHCKGVAFACKKHGDSTTSIAVQAAAAVPDRIRQIYSSAVANELVDFETSDARWGFKAKGWCTNANYTVKKTTFLLFINNRCVESTNIKRAIEQTYAAFLPKNGHPFVYLSLEIDPQRVDVNVHPTKREVNFLNEDEITQAVCEHLRSRLAAVDTSRTFRTHTLAQDAAKSSLTKSTPRRGDPAADSSPAPTKRTAASSRPYENSLVRTDTNARKITSMFAPAAAASSRPGAAAGGGTDHDAAASALAAPEPIEYDTVDRSLTRIHLLSIRELRAAVRDDMHHELTEVFANHTFVGIVDERRRLAAIQSGIKLYLVDYGRACFEYFYQLALTDFANMGAICFNPPLNLRELLRPAVERHLPRAGSGADADAEPPDVETVVREVCDHLVTHRELLVEYLSLEVTPSGELVSIPLLVRGYTPPMAKLPQFLFRLGPHNIDWAEERPCFDAILRELASFYVPEQLPPPPAAASAAAAAAELVLEIEARRKAVRWAIEHVFFPAFKARLVATNTLMKSGVLEVANLKGLYRVFERC